MKRDWFAELPGMKGLLPEADLRRNRAGVLLELLRESSDSEQLPVAELESRQRMRLRSLARHAVQESPSFAERLRASGLHWEDLGEPGGLQRLRPLGREDLMRAGEDFFCRSIPASHGSVGTTVTSGSTGEPVSIRRTQKTMAHWLAASIRERLWMGRGCEGRLGVVRANVDVPEDLPDWGPPYSQVFRTGPVSVRPPSTSMEDLAGWIQFGGFDELLVLPSCLAGVLDRMRLGGSGLGPLQVIRTVSETVSVELRERVRTVLGIEIRDSYTSQEFGVIGLQCPGSGAYHFLEQLIVEVVKEDGSPCARGEIGQLLVTDLVNWASPMVRYRIGDLAEAAGACSCGIPHRAVSRILGRERQLLRMPDGSKRWPRFGYDEWRHLGPVRQFQFVQTGPGSILARLRVDVTPDVADRDRLVECLQKHLGYPFDVSIEWHSGPLPRARGGKFHEFIRSIPEEDPSRMEVT